ncbi:RraA family protein [Anaeroglobus geminatus]|uniref:Putative 4-hydroxy-4-methyl-2-oxoglutarate aldolase n=1 Tax=Anaeroglobus geminatus F0357 TaxID=861450 RepID=G9YFS6_9FIRM|nr:RraA family protein [Anaeroglobus geminatus]EHM42894.1 demethylmenaquinone methyltransferase [Anaeroglobus geminatus F0357]
MEFTQELRGRFERLSSTNLSDAMDALGMRGFTFGIHPLQAAWRKIVGPAVTMRMIAAGQIPQKTHLGMNAIASARPGDVIVIDNGGRMDSSCWGGILANAAKIKGVAATVIDGCCRDLDDCIDADYPVYARGTVICTARGRVIEESTNQMIQCGGVQVRPGDIIFGDSSGIVCVPQEKMLEILEKAEQLWQKEEDMIAEIKAGADILAADAKYNYNKMLQK